jgi:hypothetical protein
LWKEKYNVETQINYKGSVLGDKQQSHLIRNSNFYSIF